MNIVFLDIDGVLNRYCDKSYDDFYPELMALVNQLIHPEVKFVLSSNWRYAHSLEEMREGLAEYGFKGDLIDMTPILDKGFRSQVSRGQEIEMWLNSHKGEYDKYVILDDANLECPAVEDNWVRVHSMTGLTQDLIDRAKIILGVDYGEKDVSRQKVSTKDN